MKNDSALQTVQLGICGISVSDASGDVIRCGSGEIFRHVMAGEPSSRMAIVGSDIEDVDPLNLVAALKKDNPSREVLALDTEWGMSFSDNAVMAGVDRSIDMDELEELLGNHLGAVPGTDADTVKSQDGGAQTRDAVSGICISVVSGRGGVGKSTLCMLMALVADSHGLKVTVLDMDMQFGDLGFACSQDGKFATFGYGLGNCESIKIETGGGRIPVLYPLEKPEYSEAVSGRFRSVLDNALRSSELVIVNTGAFWTDFHADLLEWSDAILFLMDQRAASVCGCRTARDLCIRMGIPSSKFLFALNRNSRDGSLSTLDCEMSLGVEKVFAISDGGEAVEEAFSLGRPSALMDGHNPLLEEVETMLGSVLSRFGLKLEKTGSGAGKSSRKGLFARRAG